MSTEKKYTIIGEQAKNPEIDKKPLVVEKPSFGKKVYIYNIILVSFLTAAAFIIIALSGVLNIMDVSPLATIVVSAYAELGLHTGFFIWKAKFENGRKYKDVNLIEQLKLENEGNI